MLEHNARSGPWVQVSVDIWLILYLEPQNNISWVFASHFSDSYSTEISQGGGIGIQVRQSKNQISIAQWSEFYHGTSKILGFCLFLNVFFHPTKEFFTHFETSPLQVKGCKFLLNVALKANEQWVSLVWHVYCDTWSSLRICDTWAFSGWAFATCLNDIGLLWPRFEDPTYPTASSLQHPGFESRQVWHTRQHQMEQYILSKIFKSLWWDISHYIIQGKTRRLSEWPRFCSWCICKHQGNLSSKVCL